MEGEDQKERPVPRELLGELERVVGVVLRQPVGIGLHDGRLHLPLRSQRDREGAAVSASFRRQLRCKRGVVPADQTRDEVEARVCAAFDRDKPVGKITGEAAYDFASPRGALFLGEYARSAQPFARVGERTVSVQVTSVVRASDRSFQVKWTETAFERGSAAGTSRWTAIFTVIVRPPKSADTLRKNPLGLYVDAIDWSSELDAPAAAPVAPPPGPVPSTPTPANPPNLPLGSPLEPNLSAPASPLQNPRTDQ